MSLKKIVPFLLLLAALIAVPVYYYTQKSGFQLDEVTWTKPLAVNWASVPNDVPLALLNQPYHFFGEGHQTYAFVSADGKTILKFVKFGYMDSMSTDERDVRLKRLFNGYLIAFQKDRENTALIALHQAEPGGTPLLVKVGGETIDLAPLYFILQKRVTPLKEILNQNKGSAQTILDKILNLYADEYRRGLYDSDHNVLYNTGFIDQRAYRLDAGRLKMLPQENRQAFIKLDLEKILTRFRKWIVKNLPEKEQAPLLKHLQERIDQIAFQ